jgi:flagellar hook-associated protein 2
MASFHVGGVVSGLDTETIISQLVAAASVPKKVMEAKQSGLSKQQDAYTELSSRLTDLQSALTSIDTATEFRSVSGSSSSTSVSDVTVDGDGVVGTYNLTVTSLAESDMFVSTDVFSAKTDSVSAAGGTFAVTYAGTTTNVTVDAGASLNTLVKSINDQVEGVTAYMMDTGSGLKLVIAGNDTGAANTVSISSSLGSLTSYTHAATAADAALSINGVPLTSTDNTVGGVVQGLTFNLNGAGTTKVKVGIDTDAMTTKLAAFVTAYNSVITYVGSQSILDTSTKLKGPFVGETVTSRLTGNMKSAVASTYSASTVVTALSQIGFKTLQSGKLELDKSALKDALENNLDDVTAIFTDSTGFNSAFQDVLDRYISSTDGTVTNRIDALGESIDGITTDISNFDDRMTAYETRLRKGFTAMEVALGKLETAKSSLSALLPSNSSSSSSSG